jgi:hypothetical protein
MSSLAAVGKYPSSKGEKVYYVNRLRYGFSIPKIGPDGKRIPRVNMATGLPLSNGRGEPEFIEETLEFKSWRSKFTDLGYWSVYVVKPDTPKLIAEELAAMAKAPNSEIMDEKTFIKHTNPLMLEAMEERDTELEALRKQVESEKQARTKADEELARIKQRNGIK